MFYSFTNTQFLEIFFLKPTLPSYMTLQEHVEGYLELSAKTRTYFATAVATWDAEFYIKVDDDVHVNIGEPSFSQP